MNISEGVRIGEEVAAATHFYFIILFNRNISCLSLRLLLLWGRVLGQLPDVRDLQVWSKKITSASAVVLLSYDLRKAN